MTTERMSVEKGRGKGPTGAFGGLRVSSHFSQQPQHIEPPHFAHQQLASLKFVSWPVRGCRFTLSHRNPVLLFLSSSAVAKRAKARSVSLSGRCTEFLLTFSTGSTCVTDVSEAWAAKKADLFPPSSKSPLFGSPQPAKQRLAALVGLR